jgi:hypothetical protein
MVSKPEISTVTDLEKAFHAFGTGDGRQEVIKI